MKNEQSRDRDRDNMGSKQQIEDKKVKNTVTKKIKKISNTEHTPKTGCEPRHC
jgi:hypothetical protein